MEKDKKELIEKLDEKEKSNSFMTRINAFEGAGVNAVTLNLLWKQREILDNDKNTAAFSNAKRGIMQVLYGKYQCSGCSRWFRDIQSRNRH